MKIIIAGSRDINEYENVEASILQSLKDWDIEIGEISEIVSGCARGVDLLGEIFASKYNIPIKKFPAQWKEFGKSAGIKRNMEMGDYADRLIAITNGSKGTDHMIKYMRKTKKPVSIHLYNSLDLSLF